MMHHFIISDLAYKIMNNRLSKYRHNCPVNITDLFFLEIENDEELLAEYHNLAKFVKGYHSLNQQFGKFIREYWYLQNLGRCINPQSRLISSYEKHSN